MNHLKIGILFSILLQVVLALARAEDPLEFTRVPAPQELAYSNGIEKGCFCREGICTGQFWVQAIHFGTPKQLAFGGAVGSDEDWFTQFVVVVPLNGGVPIWLSIKSAQQRGAYISQLYDGVNNKVLIDCNFRNNREKTEYGLLDLNSRKFEKLQSSNLDVPIWAQTRCEKFGAELPLNWEAELLKVTKTPIETVAYFGVGFSSLNLAPRFYVLPFGNNQFAALDSVSKVAPRIIVFDQGLRTKEIDSNAINTACAMNVCWNMIPPTQKMLNSEFGHCLGSCENGKYFAIRFSGEGKIEAVVLPQLSKPAQFRSHRASPSGDHHVAVFVIGDNVHNFQEILMVTNFTDSSCLAFEFPQKFKSNHRLSFRGICDDGTVVVDNRFVGMWKLQIENETSYHVNLQFKYPFGPESIIAPR